MARLFGERTRLVTVLLGASCVAFAACSSTPTRFERTDSHSPVLDRARLLSVVLESMGTPYALGGREAERGMDCSGFTSYVYSSALGRSLPHSSREQFALGEPVGRDQVQVGDLLFFSLEGRGPSHVGIYVGDGLFAHASTSRGVVLSLLESAYYRKEFVGARRIVH